ncbi:MAG: carbohydrate kinase family protein [Methanobacteriaceae archaeon]
MTKGKNKRDLLAIGHTALDYIIKVEDFPAANTSASIDKMKQLYGGAAANVAMVGASLNLKTSLVSAVGKEFVDSKYHKQMKDLGINTDSMIISESENTPTAFVLTDDNKDQISYFYWGAGKKFQEIDAPIDAISNVRAVHLATGDPNFNHRSGIVANEMGDQGDEKLVSFDPGQDLHMYTLSKLKEVLNCCDILFGNHHEIDRILKSLNVDINELRELGPTIVVKTCGKDGSHIYSNEKIEIDPIYRPAVDPTGAGDSYRAGFLKAYLNGESLEDCGKLASAVSSFIVEKEGCQTNIPSLDLAKKRMNEFY